MAKSQETFGKKEKEKKKIQKQKEKAEKKEERKANAKNGNNLDDMLAYVDEYGNITSTPPDPSKKIQINSEDIQLGVPRYVEVEDVPGVPKNGVVTFYNDAKGFGFIKETNSQESFFVHANNITENIKENDKVSFDTEKGPKGLMAVNVKKV